MLHVINSYHQNHQIGVYIKLIQFYYQTYRNEESITQTYDIELLLDLLRNRKINSRRIKVKCLVVRVIEIIDHPQGMLGYIAVVDTLSKKQISIGHNQYPTYQRTVKHKYLWTLYHINVHWAHRVIEEEFEEYERVKALIAQRRIPKLLRRAINRVVGRADMLQSARYDDQ